ncbi:hypothetical protein LOTGIDRAFT_230371 [Lottia gigantea]|uniref:Breast cancer metastasis-suppressor 1-like protein-A n=1 Tax=Lottia gigantea TaxID=225164 RepID=V4AFT7_LOTGI|nr:hypothetical protein LOTGIDRAFT_230371 [Lottia gigantea]ESP02869.1 hypothetical protein LOTGIDRAFT_230371 [Lottia gigantea]
MPNLENGQNNTEEDMEQDIPQSESSDEESGSTEEGDSELDDEECERRRNECLEDMSELERQFCLFKEELCKERYHQYEIKLEEVRHEKAEEYLLPLAQLENESKVKCDVAAIFREHKIWCIKVNFESEEIAAYQNMKSERAILADTVKQELEDKIRRLEEDRNNIDISSDLWHESQSQKKKKKSDPFHRDRRRKPVVVSGPYIVYMLRESDIIDDWTTIKKALKQQKQQNQKRKIDYLTCMQNEVNYQLVIHAHYKTTSKIIS